MEGMELLHHPETDGGIYSVSHKSVVLVTDKDQKGQQSAHRLFKQVVLEDLGTMKGLANICLSGHQ